MTAGSSQVETPNPRELADWLIARGQHWITTADAAEVLDIPISSVPSVLTPLRKQAKLFSPTRGAYVPIPPEYRNWKVVPASHFIDPWMRHLGHSYYVSLLSAAEVHGAAHQRPQVFQVVTNARIHDRTFERVQMEFVFSSSISARPTTTVNTPTGSMLVSTPETTVLDLVSAPAHGGGISNVATVVCELIENEMIDSSLLVKASKSYPLSVIARLGWIIERFNSPEIIDVSALAKKVIERTELSLLVPGEPNVGDIDRRWKLRINSEVEADL